MHAKNLSHERYKSLCEAKENVQERLAMLVMLLLG
jgi:hypothetical protein